MRKISQFRVKSAEWKIWDHLWDAVEINRPLFGMGKLTHVSISKLAVHVVVPGFRDKTFTSIGLKCFPYDPSEYDFRNLELVLLHLMQRKMKHLIGLKMFKFAMLCLLCHVPQCFILFSSNESFPPGESATLWKFRDIFNVSNSGAWKFHSVAKSFYNKQRR